MTEDRPRVEAVVLARLRADVVDDERYAARPPAIAHDPHVVRRARRARAEAPHHDVPGSQLASATPSASKVFGSVVAYMRRYVSIGRTRR